jgi:hypothetical protein
MCTAANDMTYEQLVDFLEHKMSMSHGMQKDWRELCVAVTNESDPTKLSSLVQELIEALDKGERSWRPTVCPRGGLVTNQEAA